MLRKKAVDNNVKYIAQSEQTREREREREIYKTKHKKLNNFLVNKIKKLHKIIKNSLKRAAEGFRILK